MSAGDGSLRSPSARVDADLPGRAGLPFPETVELLHGMVLDGTVDRRGTEGALLAGEKLWGLSVVELAPVSAWLSSHVASRCATYAVVERPPGAGPVTDEARSHWTQVMDALGLRPAHLPGEVPGGGGPHAGFDVVLLFGALSRAANPLALLHSAVRHSNNTVIVIEPAPADTDAVDGAAYDQMALIPEALRSSDRSWQVSPGLVERLLTRAGFTCRVARGAPSAGPPPSGFVTVVARRLDRRPAPRRAEPEGVVAQASLPLERHPTDVGAAERLPLPPSADRLATHGTADAEVFTSVGRHAFERMAHALARNGAPAGPGGRVLEVDCGFSQVLRWWRMVPDVEAHGTDTDVAAVTWNRQQLGFGTFGINTLDPRLAYASTSFSLVYALSLFTHLPEALQLPWAGELFRVLRPGGLLYFATHGQSYRGLLPPAYHARFDAGTLVSSGLEDVGKSSCVAFHPAEWVRRRLVPAIGAELLELAEALAETPGEDCWLLRKPSRS